MTKEEGQKLKPGDIVQIDPMHGYTREGNRAFACCLAIVDEVKEWGVQCYVQALGTREERGGAAFYRVKWIDLDYCGQAMWTIGIGLMQEEEK